MTYTQNKVTLFQNSATFNLTKTHEDIMELHSNFGYILEYTKERIGDLLTRNGNRLEELKKHLVTTEKSTSDDELEVVENRPTVINLDSDEEGPSPAPGIRCKTVSEINNVVQSGTSPILKKKNPTPPVTAKKIPLPTPVESIIDLSCDENVPDSAAEDVPDSTAEENVQIVTGILDEVIDSLFVAADEKENAPPEPMKKTQEARKELVNLLNRHKNIEKVQKQQQTVKKIVRFFQRDETYLPGQDEAVDPMAVDPMAVDLDYFQNVVHGEVHSILKKTDGGTNKTPANDDQQTSDVVTDLTKEDEMCTETDEQLEDAAVPVKVDDVEGEVPVKDLNTAAVEEDPLGIPEHSEDLATDKQDANDPLQDNMEAPEEFLEAVPESPKVNNAAENDNPKVSEEITEKCQSPGKDTDDGDEDAIMEPTVNECEEISLLASSESSQEGTVLNSKDAHAEHPSDPQVLACEDNSRDTGEEEFMDCSDAVLPELLEAATDEIMEVDNNAVTDRDPQEKDIVDNVLLNGERTNGIQSLITEETKKLTDPLSDKEKSIDDVFSVLETISKEIDQQISSEDGVSTANGCGVAVSIDN